MRPARGCRREGSGRAASPKKEDTSAAVFGSNVVVAKGVDDGDVDVVCEGESGEEDDWSRWPVILRQSDILPEKEMDYCAIVGAVP